jgi:general secretion pathway protein H
LRVNFSLPPTGKPAAAAGALPQMSLPSASGRAYYRGHEPGYVMNPVLPGVFRWRNKSPRRPRIAGPGIVRGGHACRRACPGAGGFTLLETIVVVVVLGLMLTILAGFVPRRPERLELANAADSIAATLRLARARSIATARPVIVQAVTGQAGGAGQGGVSALLVDGVARPLAGRPAIAMAGPPAIRFAPDGSASGGAVRVVGQTRTMLVTVEWLTGRVAITEARGSDAR